METLEFEKPGSFCGQLSLSLSQDGTKEITLYHLEVVGERRKGKGREALACLKKLFKGDLYVEDPGIIRVKNANEESLPFWVKMFQEGYIDALDSEACSLSPRTSETEIERVTSGHESAHKIDSSS